MRCISAFQMIPRRFLKKCTFRSGLVALLAALAGLIAMLPGSAQAQAIVVNGLSCPAASVQFTSAGMVATLPAGCSGNGNPCDSALVTFSATGIDISAPAACLTASPTTAPVALQTVNVNGNGCSGATVTLSATGIAVNAPLACLGTATPAPVISTVSPTAAYAGQTATITGMQAAR